MLVAPRIGGNSVDGILIEGPKMEACSLKVIRRKGACPKASLIGVSPSGQTSAGRVTQRLALRGMGFKVLTKSIFTMLGRVSTIIPKPDRAQLWGRQASKSHRPTSFA